MLKSLKSSNQVNLEWSLEMKEKKSELKVVLLCIVLIGANLLGIDIVAISQFVINNGQETIKEVDSSLTQARVLLENRNEVSMSTLIAVLGGLYGTWRTIVKSIHKWKFGEKNESSNKMGETVE